MVDNTRLNSHIKFQADIMRLSFYRTIIFGPDFRYYQYINVFKLINIVIKQEYMNIWWITEVIAKLWSFSLKLATIACCLR